MLFIVLSPAKTLNKIVLTPESQKCTIPKLLPQATALAQKLKSYSIPTLKEMYKASQPIAKLNHERWKSFDEITTETTPALLTFNGPAYKGVNAVTFTDNEWKFAMDHVGILCGLYGILNVMDGIKPYRLEMGTKLPDDSKTSLYDYWKDDITKQIITSLESPCNRKNNDKKKKKKTNTTTTSSNKKILLNLASQEYYKSINENILTDNNIHVVTCVFKDDGKIKSVYAKEARGLMTRYVIQNEIDDVEEIKNFNVNGYEFSDNESDDLTFIFHRCNDKKRKR